MMGTLCAATYEFAPVCSGILNGLWDICSQLQDRAPADCQVIRETNSLVSFCSTLFRFCTLLFQIAKRTSTLTRFIGSRAIAEKIRGFHEELDHSVDILHVSPNNEDWTTLSRDEHTLVHHQLEMLTTDEALMAGCSDTPQTLEAAMLLQYELKARSSDGSDPALQASFKDVQERFIQASGIEDLKVPEWFIFSDDLEYHSWNRVRSENSIEIFEGRWRKSSVMIEYSFLELDDFVKSVTQWYALSHPHVANLFGACHIGPPKLLIFERIPEGRPLHEFLSIDASREWEKRVENSPRASFESN